MNKLDNMKMHNCIKNKQKNTRNKKTIMMHTKKNTSKNMMMSLNMKQKNNEMNKPEERIDEYDEKDEAE